MVMSLPALKKSMIRLVLGCGSLLPKIDFSATQIRTKSALVSARLMPSNAICTDPPAALPFES